MNGTCALYYDPGKVETPFVLEEASLHFSATMPPGCQSAGYL